MTEKIECPDNMEEFDDFVEECYACGQLGSNKLCKVHDEMLKEMQEVSRTY